MSRAFSVTARFVAACALLAGAGLVAATDARAQAPEEFPFAGTFTYVPEESDDVEAAIGRAVEHMNFLVKRIARPRLRNTNVPYGKVTITRTATELSIATDERAPVVSPAAGTPIKWTREDGEVFDVTTVLEGGRLVQSFTAEDGSRENAFTLSPDGDTLTMTVTIRSDRLREPLVYKLLYRRTQ